MSVDGNWKLTINTPRGSQESTLTVQSNGGTFTGTLAGARGTTEIKDGKVDGDKLSWSMQMTQPMPMTISYTGTVDGDKLNGNVQFGSFGGGAFTGVRA
jgi:hypothetical protein